ncbi:proteasome alpha 3 subunit, putative [Trypanosoma equiperdum]|uniref:Proteasome subunit alpha type n=4 Tax=Trypanozoon TaxID=39700 RepID=Q57X58_TRYB2|nr:proteasome alpha 3 subunit, putative [Trypanosoma brucei gambiense DAL972]XP_846065.1 proteasome alpha 3 subunit, putative [Trypanosoma brucei brucei TREU927]AAX69811.1 proteasome alpha 3 subunit, putative [Trypanosoma brucei]RHW71252.1 proteasome alpha 3 subunit [Trypanosoma brucei equiperdum]SCU71991.1 proteasome alpha 3 subunit, putative [Trypanosoma equiperdum]AAZ12506.1 proteasome alpha 3 subunit, putative [Trypanosoma brucei brucei TREU927]CBH12584.1 proteasome alpha 3 subunit, putat|eukprot:XP_011774864.1 proteasome alpha 3 subunit, putative [Trypanosoma brucei gambiense DAL972]
MSSRYDSRTTTFSPEGRLYQVEYAEEAISQAGTIIGILTTGGVVLGAERGQQHGLFDTENMEDRNISGEKVYKISNHLGCSVAGVTSDAYALINYARLSAARHFYSFQEPIAAEDLCRMVCDEKQLYTQYGGVRPFGVSFLFAGWDRHYGYQLYHTDASGNYSAWRAYAVGQNDQVAQSLLKRDWKPELTLEEGIVLCLRVLGKTMDAVKLTPERLEVAVLQRVQAPLTQKLLDPYGVNPKMVPSFKILTDEELKPHVDEANRQREAEEAEEAEKEKKNEKRLASP